MFILLFPRLCRYIREIKNHIEIVHGSVWKYDPIVSLNTGLSENMTIVSLNTGLFENMTIVSL